MLKNYFTIAIRNLWKNKVLSFINIFGLAAGMACSLLIFLFVTDELSYDRFNKDADRVYRVVKDFVNDDGSKLPDATTPPAIAPAIQKEIPGIEHVTRVFPGWGNNFLFTYKDKHIYEQKLYRVDSSFFDVFTFPFVEGAAKNAFKEVNSVVITQTTAKKYFGAEDPMGKILHEGRLGDLIVTGVVKDVPHNAHFHFDFLIPIRKLAGDIDGNWGFYNFYTYIKLRPNVNIKSVESSIQAIYKRNSENGKNIFYTQPLTGIHLDSNLKWELEPNSERLYVFVFSAVALLILLIAAINYINLVTARSSLRAKEVGIRKVSGAYKSSLIKQFLLESVVTCMLASAVALIIAQLLLPVVNSITQKQLSLFSSDNYFTIYFLGAALLIGVVAGLAPALYLSSFKPIVVLKGSKMNERNVFNLRKALVVIQFTISISLIAGACIIYQQVNYIQNAKLGLNKDQVLLIRDYGAVSPPTANSFENALLQIPGVKDAATADGVVGGQNWTNSMSLKGSKNSQLINFLSVGYDYLDVLGIQIKEGRNFSRDFPADTISYVSNHQLNEDIGSIILNEKAVKDLGVPSPAVGQRILWSNDGDTNYYCKIIGVAKDFHFASFRSEIKPFAFVVIPRRTDYLTIKLSTQNLPATIQKIESTWKAFVPDRPIQYSFLDETFAELYRSEANFQQVFIVLVILSIVIACLGLFGLAAFTAEQRTKEIGIRKVLGATVTGIAAMLTKDFLKLVVISILVASPLAYWAMSKWLQDYAYRIQISWWVFFIAGVMAVIIAVMTISFQAIKAAVANPVRSLRTE
ncbi:MAG TPA: ABC transporter permease [Parafilimonas sp.]|nr:ABC transporter permease [Parafilimonas sp.]